MNQNQTYIKYGLLIGLASITVELLVGVGGLTGMIFLGFGINYLHKNIKSQNEGELSFGKGVVTGMVLSLISGVVIGIYTWVDLLFNRKLLKDILNEAAYFLEDAGIEGEMFDEIMNLYEIYLTPFWVGVSALLGQLFIGFLLSLFITIFTYKQVNRFK